MPKATINITNDDLGCNDYLYCWNEFNLRPNKLNLFNNYDPIDFLKFISDNKLQNTGTFTDVIPADDNYVINERSLVKIHNSIFIGYVHFDKLGEESAISEITFYYLNDAVEKVNSIVKEFDDFLLDLDIEFDSKSDDKKLLSCLSVSPNGLDLEKMSPLNADYDNIDSYFEDNVIKSAEKLTKSLKKQPKGLSIIHGERGCGKTTLVNYITQTVEKEVICVPYNMIESTFTPDFIGFIKRHKNCVLIIDDCELYFSETYSKSNIFTNNILQFVDGMHSDNFNVHIIVIANTGDVNSIDHSLFECNNLIHVIEVTPISKNKATDLSKLIGKNIKFKSPTKLVDVLKKRPATFTEKEIGF